MYLSSYVFDNNLGTDAGYKWVYPSCAGVCTTTKANSNSVSASWNTTPNNYQCVYCNDTSVHASGSTITLSSTHMLACTYAASKTEHISTTLNAFKNTVLSSYPSVSARGAEKVIKQQVFSSTASLTRYVTSGGVVYVYRKGTIGSYIQNSKTWKQQVEVSLSSSYTTYKAPSQTVTGTSYYRYTYSIPYAAALYSGFIDGQWGRKPIVSTKDFLSNPKQSTNDNPVAYLDKRGYWLIHIAGMPGAGSPYYYKLDMVVYKPDALLPQRLSLLVPNPAANGSSLSVNTSDYATGFCGLLLYHVNNSGWGTPRGCISTRSYLLRVHPNALPAAGGTSVAYAPFTLQMQVDGSPDTSMLPSSFYGADNFLPAYDTFLTASGGGGLPVILYCAGEGLDAAALTNTVTEKSCLAVVPGTGGVGSELLAVGSALTKEELSCYPRYIEHPLNAEVNPDTDLPLCTSAYWRKNKDVYTQTLGSTQHSTPGRYSLKEFYGFVGGHGGNGIAGGINGVYTRESDIWSVPAHVSFTSSAGSIHVPSLQPSFTPETSTASYISNSLSVTAVPGSSNITGFTGTTTLVAGGNLVNPPFSALFYNVPDSVYSIPTTAGQDGLPFIARRGTPVRSVDDTGSGVEVVDYVLTRALLSTDRFSPGTVLKDVPDPVTGETIEQEKWGRNYMQAFTSEDCIMKVKYLGDAPTPPPTVPLYFF